MIAFVSRPSRKAWSLPALHSGHQLPCLIELKEASQRCPILHSHSSFTWLLEYCPARHRPPRSAATEWSACTEWRSFASAHFLHQCPWRIECATARQRCTLAHYHSLQVRRSTLLYS